MFDASCQVTCRKTISCGLHIQVLFSTTRFNIILLFKSDSFQLSLTITSSKTNFVYISRYKVGDRTDLPSTKLPRSLQKGLQCGRLNEFFVAWPSPTVHPVYRTDVPLPSRDGILYICEQIYLLNFLIDASQCHFFPVNKVPFISKCHHFWFIKYSYVTSMVH